MPRPPKHSTYLDKNKKIQNICEHFPTFHVDLHLDHYESVVEMANWRGLFDIFDQLGATIRLAALLVELRTIAIKRDG